MIGTPDNLGSKGIYGKAVGCLTELMESERMRLRKWSEMKGAGSKGLIQGYATYSR